MKRPTVKYKCRHGSQHTRKEYEEMSAWSTKFTLRMLTPGSCWFKLQRSMATAAEIEAATTETRGEKPC